jgi:tRNA A37 threonylcarbamoyladenosine modification protein TsaB
VWIDAHRGEVFAMLFAADGAVIRPPTSLPPAATLDLWMDDLRRFDTLRFTGDGAVRHADEIRRRLSNRAIVDTDARPLAGTIATIAYDERDRAVRPHAVVPMYVRRPDAELARERRQP